VPTAEFSFSWNRFMRILMYVLFAGPRHSTIRVDHDSVRVTMGVRGWAFTANVPLLSIADATEVAGPVWAWGAHGWRGRWLVNGSSRGLVRLTIMPKAHGRCAVFPLRVGELTLSLADPAGFVRAVTPSAHRHVP
jgi:hypothetical protein